MVGAGESLIIGVLVGAVIIAAVAIVIVIKKSSK